MFIDKVVAAGASSRWPVHRGPHHAASARRATKLLNGEGRRCALIDDAQLSSLGSAPVWSRISPFWSSDKLPPMVVAAFPSRRRPEDRVPG